MRLRTVANISAPVILFILLANLAPLPSSPSNQTTIKMCRIEMRSLITAANMYLQEYGTYPNWKQMEVVMRLRGDNPRQIVFLHVSSGHFDSRKGFLDPWGTPFQIAAQPGTNLIIRSAGKNRRFDDTDDIVESTGR